MVNDQGAPVTRPWAPTYGRLLMSASLGVPVVRGVDHIAALRPATLITIFSKRNSVMNIVITYGTFDLFHVGHVRLLKRLRGMGDKLIVGCSTDEFNQRKGKRAVTPYAQRVEILESCRYVDEVFAENDWAQKRSDILRFGATIFAMGDDWSGKFDELSDIVNVVYLPRTSDISTTDVKQMVHRLAEDRISELKNACGRLQDIIATL